MMGAIVQQIMGPIVRLTMGAIVAIIAGATIAPSVALNIASVQNNGGGLPFAIVAVISVVAAPFCLSVLSKLLQAKRFDLAAGAVVVFGLALTYNITNAVGLVGGERDSHRESREAKIAIVKSIDEKLSQTQSSLAELRKLTGDATPQMLDSDLVRLKTDHKYTRAAQCTHVTLQDSGELCGQIADTEKKKATAERVVELQADERALLTRRENVGAAPSSPDTKVDRITRLLGLLIPISKEGDQWVGVGLDVLAAVLVEVMAAFLPPIAALCFWPVNGTFGPKPSNKAGKETPKRNVGARAKKAPPPASSRSSVELFAERCIVHREGAMIKGADLYNAYCVFCESISVEPESNTRFGRTMPDLGFKKEPGRIVIYHNIALQEPRQQPRLVIGGSGR